MIQRRSTRAPKIPERKTPEQKQEEMLENPGVPLANRLAITVPEMAEALHISPTIAYELSKQPDFPSFYIGHRKLINLEGLQRWMDERCKGVAEPNDEDRAG